jgi:hypothetical protein
MFVEKKHYFSHIKHLFVNPTMSLSCFFSDLFSSNGIAYANLIQDNTHLPTVSVTKSKESFVYLELPRSIRHKCKWERLTRKNSHSSMRLSSRQGDGKAASDLPVARPQRKLSIDFTW